MSWRDSRGGLCIFVGCVALFALVLAGLSIAHLGDLAPESIVADGTTTPRALAARFADQIDVLDFGADPSGASGSDAAFIAADAAAQAAGGKVISIPYGTYKLESWHNLANNVNMWIRGPNVRFTGSGWISPMTDGYTSGTSMYRTVKGTGGENTLAVGIAIQPSSGPATYQDTAIHAHAVNTDNNPAGGGKAGVAYQAIAEIAGQSNAATSEVWGMHIRAITGAHQDGAAIGLEIGSENYGPSSSDYSDHARKAAMQVYAAGSSDSLFAYMAASASPRKVKFYDGFVAIDNAISGHFVRLINTTGSGPASWFSVDPRGAVYATSVQVATTFALTPATPPSSSSPCVAGQVAVDTTHVYVCTAPNTWKRAALSAW